MGVYKPKQGMMDLDYAWGHDEYAYQVIKHHTDKRRAAGEPEDALIPDEGLAMLRFHSCYPWHNKGEYKHFMREGDDELMAAVLKVPRPPRARAPGRALPSRAPPPSLFFFHNTRHIDRSDGNSVGCRR